MALTLKSKTPVRFEWTDDEAETVVTLSADDSPEALVRKLRRVIALTEPKAPPPHLSGGVVTWPVSPGNPAARGVMAEPPEIPDRLKGEVEYEGGNGWEDLGDGEDLPIV